MAYTYLRAQRALEAPLDARVLGERVQHAHEPIRTQRARGAHGELPAAEARRPPVEGDSDLRVQEGTDESEAPECEAEERAAEAARP